MALIQLTTTMTENEERAAQNSNNSYLENKAILYDNETGGSTGAITLNETAANFVYMDIFYLRTGSVNFARVYNPDGKKVTFTCINHYSSYTYLNSEEATISGTTINRGEGMETRLASTPAIGRWSANWAYITRVVGYR